MTAGSAGVDPIVTVSANSVVRGEAVDVVLRHGVRPPEAVNVAFTINRVDAVAGGFQAQTTAPLAADGSASASFDTTGWLREAVFSVFELGFFDSNAMPVRTMCLLSDALYLHVREPGEEAWDLDQIRAQLQEFKARQRELYGQPLGDPRGEGVKKWQGVVAVEQLLLHTGLLAPGAEAQPTGIGNPATSEAEILDMVMTSLDPHLAHAVSGSEWARRSERERPVSVLLFPAVFARELAEADELVRKRRDELLDLLALKRRASARVLGTVLTEPAGRQVKIQLGVPSYRGNLIGGEMAGESQLDFTLHDRAARHDPVLALVLALIRDAHRELNDDFAYFRYWSILEVLAEHRVPSFEPVVLRSGEPLLGSDHKQRTTRDKAPRVYVFISSWLDGRRIDESSLVSPAADLWEAIEVWYARRNATAHRGRFDPLQDDRYGRHSKAMKSHSPAGATRDEWLARLRDVTTSVIEWELSTSTFAPPHAGSSAGPTPIG